MKTRNLRRSPGALPLLAALGAALTLASSASAQLVAYDDAGNYLVSANWTNGANQGFGFGPWSIVTNGPNFHGTYIDNANIPQFVIATVTNVNLITYTNVWGVFANGTNNVNETTAFRPFASPLGTNTFKLQWGSRGAGVQTNVDTLSQAHGSCGFTLRNGNAVSGSSDFATGARFWIYFTDGNSPATIWVADGSANSPISLTGTSFSDLGRGDITNALEVEVTPAANDNDYHLVVKDCVSGKLLYTLNSTLAGSGTIDSAALFCHETTGDQVYNHMQIAIPRIPPTIANVQPPNGTLYLSANANALSFEVDSFSSTVSSSLVTASLNGVPQSGLAFNTTSPTNQLLASWTASLAPNTFYTLQITSQDANGDATTNLSTFNTFLATDLYIDAQDYNYGAGLFVNSSTPNNAYANLFGTNGIDYLDVDLTGTNNLYRPGDLPQVLSLATDASGDPIDHAGERLGGGTVYNIGFTDLGEWQNYTRAIPSPTNYSVYARAASANGGQFEIEQLANATATVSNQPLAALGRVIVPSTGGSRVYAGQLMPLTDLFGNTVIVPLSGTRTLRCTAVASRVYNLEYLVVVPVTNAAATILRPYISVGSPTPNATGVGVAGQILFTIANRQTSVLTNTIQAFLNTNNITSRLVMSSNAVGTAATWTPTNNLAVGATNTITVTFTDSASVNLTNSWSFVTGTSGGVLGTGIWSGGGGTNDLLWADGINWTGGTPGPGFSATFASPGATTSLVTNNIVGTNVTILQLCYSTNNSGFHTTLIQDGVTLMVTNGSVANGTEAFQVGGFASGGTTTDNAFNQKVTNTITGPGGTLRVVGNPQGSGLVNALNFQVRQCATTPAAEQTVLDMSGLGTCIATVGKFTVGQGGTGVAQSNCTARVNLARTNVISLLRFSSGTFVVGDSSGSSNTLMACTLNLGVSNALFFDTMNVGKQKATNALVRFNPAFTSFNPVAYIRDTNGPLSRVGGWNIGDAATEVTAVPVYAQGTVDLTGGTVDALVNTMIVGRGATATSDSGYAQGTLAFNAGTVDVNTLQVGVQRANNTATAGGTVNVFGTATLVSTNIVLAQTAGGASPSLVSGTLNVTNGTLRANITPGGGTSTINVDGATFVVPRFAGLSTSGLSALNLKNASLHLNVDSTVATAPVYAHVSASGTTITIDSVANVTNAQTIHLIAYGGADPYPGLSLAPLPAGYTGGLVDNSANSFIDLSINVSTTPPSPTIRGITVSGGQVIISGTNNSGGTGTYSVLTSTNLTLPRSNWTVLQSGSFNGFGNFSATNTASTNRQRFFILQVPVP